MNFSRAGLSELLKDGTKHISGVDQAVLRNIEATVQLSTLTRTSMGPNGMNKIVINHLEKLFVTHDAATILKELEVIHPAAKIAVLAAQAQEVECGDGTNFVVCLCGELMQRAEDLLRMGLHTSDIIEGYKKGVEKASEIMESLVIKPVSNLRDEKEVSGAMKSALSAKLYGYEDIISPVVARACINACPKNFKNFNVDNIRVLKINGGAIHDIHLIEGFAIERDTHGTVKHVKDGVKVAVFGCNLDTASTETKHSVVIKSASDLLSYSNSEEESIEREIKSIADSGVKVVVSSGGFGEMALHFIERCGMMAIKVASKFQLRRLCQAIGATALVRVGPPTADEMGNCDSVHVEEIGDTKVIVFRQDPKNVDRAGLSTIVARGATQNVLDEIERAIDDGVNVYKQLTKDQRLVAGAGAFEIELARQLTSFAEETPGIEQYAIKKYAESFHVVPRTIAESAGYSATDIISKLNAAHEGGKVNFGVSVEDKDGMDAVEESIVDPFTTKYWAAKFATDAAVTILSVDQIIMARPAGGPKPRNPNAGNNWDDTDEHV
ncbi:T-complex protein 1 subunit theta CCT8 [Acrasis kona]|uniref:CCT-theta n=1 Tax=Acrasis kona TaxID=1008807 RepID=A0AAW2Z561_9EUKA